MLKKKERVHFILPGYSTLSMYGSHFNWEYVSEKKVVYLHINLSDNLKDSQKALNDYADCEDLLKARGKIGRIQINSRKVGEILESGLTSSKEFNVPLQIRLNFGQVQANYNIKGGKLSEFGVDAQVTYAD